MPKEICFTVFVDEKLKKLFKKTVAENGLKIGFVVNNLLKQYIEENKEG